jgi:hypothetical protein
MQSNATPDVPAARDSLMMVQIDMDLATFNSDWMHCDYIATYLARTIGHNRPDSVLFANLFSSALNEMLEIVFRTRDVGGAFACKISRQHDVDRVSLTFTCTEDERRFFEQAIMRAQGDDGEAHYMAALSGDPGPSREMLLLELAVSYNATIRMDARSSEDTLTVIVDLPLGGRIH